MDGASKRNPGPSGGGGCFRNPHGQVKLGFSYYYGIGSNMVAEGRALLDGLRLAQLHNIRLFAIFTDSQILVELLNKKKDPPWSLLPWWNSLLHIYYTLDCPIIHIYREANQVAGALANYAVLIGGNSEFSSTRELPMLAKCYAIADANGIPNVRRRHV